MRRSIAALTILAALAIVPAAQAKRVDRVGTQCDFTNIVEYAPTVCGVQANEVVIGASGGGACCSSSLGFRVTKHKVRLGLSIAVSGGFGFVDLEKRTHDTGKYYYPSGKPQGKFLFTPDYTQESGTLNPGGPIGTERFDLSKGYYVIDLQLQLESLQYGTVPFVLTITGTPSGWVKPYIKGLFFESA
jgi:hypothetical protein